MDWIIQSENRYENALRLIGAGEETKALRRKNGVSDVPVPALLF